MSERRLISVAENKDFVPRRATYPDYVNDTELKISEPGMVTAELKYLTRDASGSTDQTLAQRFYDVAHTMAEVETQYGASADRVEQLTREFYDLMASNKFIPGGRVLTNAGTSVPSYFNCYVLEVPDSIPGIFEAVKRGAIIHKSGGGTGYNFSTVRPRGVYIPSSKGIASGPVSFMEVFDVATSKINAGNRRGANMGILNIEHPDIMEFIYAKAKQGKLTNFNVSVGASDAFMDAVRQEGYFPLLWNDLPLVGEDLQNFYRNIAENKLGASEVGESPDPPSLLLHANGREVIDHVGEQVIGRIGENGVVELYGPTVMDTISQLAWKTGDPGMIFLDRVNRDNPLIRSRGKIMATNPCGEQPLHYNDACNLGSINLASYVVNSAVDYSALGSDIDSEVRFMDNVNDANKGPLPEVEETTRMHRRIGLGVMGLHDMLIDLGIPYASEGGRNKAEEVMRFISERAKKASVALAREKGTFQPFAGSVYDTGNPDDAVRNVQRTTIAPTGSISMVAGVAGGIEPIFGLTYDKKLRGGQVLRFVVEPFERIAKERGFYSPDLIARIYDHGGSIQKMNEIPADVRELFAVAGDIPVKDHILMQAAIQRATDNAVSKTINLPNSATPTDVRETYLLAHEHGLKGITVYRDGSKEVQVLVAGGKKSTPTTLESLLTCERPEDVFGRTDKFKTPFGSALMTFNATERDGRVYPFEVVLNIGKGGGDIPSMAEGYGRLVSLALKAGVPPQMIIDQLQGIGGETQEGYGPHRIRSFPDGIAQAMIKLAAKVLGESDNDDKDAADKKRVVRSGNICPECKTGTLVREEGCEKCYSCSSARC